MRQNPPLIYRLGQILFDGRMALLIFALSSERASVLMRAPLSA